MQEAEAAAETLGEHVSEVRAAPSFTPFAEGDGVRTHGGVPSSRSDREPLDLRGWSLGLQCRGRGFRCSSIHTLIEYLQQHGVEVSGSERPTSKT